MQNKLILASESPRRQDLLRQVRIPFTAQASNIDESQLITADPIQKVKQLATLKGESIQLADRYVVLAADTVVSFKGTIFKKPANQKEAYRMIATLSGSVHDVYTGVMIASHQYRNVFAVRTQVEFWPLTEQEIKWYVETEEPYDKAGAYGIQSLGSLFVKQIIGDYYNVVGLPLSQVVRELRNVAIYPN